MVFSDRYWIRKKKRLIFTKEQLICLFKFISYGKPGIPQSDNNIVSNFIGYLYLAFGDLFIDEMLRENKNIIDRHKIIRYTDDIYICIEFKPNIDLDYIHSIAAQITEVLYSELGLKLNLKTRLYRLSTEKEKEELLKSIRKTSPSDEYFGIHQDDEKEKLTSEKHQETLEQIFEKLRNIKKSRVEDYFVRGSSAGEEVLQKIFDKSIKQLLRTPSNKQEIQRIFKDFNFNLIKVQPLEILIILLKDENASTEFKKFCLDKRIVTTGDADLILKFLCQTNFIDQDILQQLKRNIHMSDIINIFLDKKLNCDNPGYYNLTCMQIKNLSDMPDVLEQTRLRILNERSLSYSVALNHLVNEIHAICIEQEQANKKNYDVNNVVNFLQSKGVKHQICIKIRNLFDRRNSNSVSHPGSGKSIAWEVTKEEYLDYYKHVGQCLDFLL